MLSCGVGQWVKRPQVTGPLDPAQRKRAVTEVEKEPDLTEVFQHTEARRATSGCRSYSHHAEELTNYCSGHSKVRIPKGLGGLTR